MLLPGLGPGQARTPVDATRAPWSAVVRVQIPGVSRCTGFAVAPTLIVTAAHCLYGRALGHMLPAASVHVLAGYRAGAFSAHATALSYRLFDGFRVGEGDPGADVAVLTLERPVTTTVLAWAPTRWGGAATLGGYSQDRAEALLADPDCRVLGVEHPVALPLRRHNCAGTRGTSGAPLLVRGADGGWAAAGVQVQGNENDAGGLAIPAATVQRLLEQ